MPEDQHHQCRLKVNSMALQCIVLQIKSKVFLCLCEYIAVKCKLVWFCMYSLRHRPPVSLGVHQSVSKCQPDDDDWTEWSLELVEMQTEEYASVQIM